MSFCGAGRGGSVRRQKNPGAARGERRGRQEGRRFAKRTSAGPAESGSRLDRSKGAKKAGGEAHALELGGELGDLRLERLDFGLGHLVVEGVGGGFGSEEGCRAGTPAKNMMGRFRRETIDCQRLRVAIIFRGSKPASSAVVDRCERASSYSQLPARQDLPTRPRNVVPRGQAPALHANGEAKPTMADFDRRLRGTLRRST